MTFINLHVENWRCIEKLNIQLSTINVFIGPNSSGKSSLAYAIYLLARAPKVKDVKALIKGLYGLDVSYVARLGCNGPCYPLSLKASEDSRGVELKIESIEKISIKGELWEHAYLLPSQRVDLFKLYQSISSIILSKEVREALESFMEKSTLSFISSLIFMFIGTFHTSASVFIEEISSLMSPPRVSGKIAEIGDIGSIIYSSTPLQIIMDSKYIDPFVHVELPAVVAPDGMVDLGLLESFLLKTEPRSLIVIEEPENYKHPLKLIGSIKTMVIKALEKNITLVMTTHNDLVLHAIAKAVEEGQLKPEDVAIYYLERSSEKPWTTAKKIKVYEDGTFEELPHIDKVVSFVF